MTFVWAYRVGGELCAAPETAFDFRRRSAAEELEVQADDDTLF